ncbi:histone H2A type 1-F-like [Peromyscus maniculatus bairdii]|uniref:histone H2A type 1-F-like n=1 Tax=Peromyscus maniculatus bairdii TaxID=230844 RepID=UPI003FD580FC
MSGHGKARAKAKTRSSWAGLLFPVGHVHRLLHKGDYSERVGTAARVYLAAMLESPGVPGGHAGVPDGQDPGAGWQRGPMTTRSIIPRHLQQTIHNEEEELNKLLGRA